MPHGMPILSRQITAINFPFLALSFAVTEFDEYLMLYFMFYYVIVCVCKWTGEL